MKTLPHLLARIMEAAGAVAMLKLVAAAGGGKFYVPMSPTPDCRLSRIVGQVAAEKIAKALGHGEVMVPLGPRSVENRMVAAVAELTAENKSANQIALALGVTERTVFRCRRISKGRQMKAGNTAASTSWMREKN